MGLGLYWVMLDLEPDMPDLRSISRLSEDLTGEMEELGRRGPTKSSWGSLALGFRGITVARMAELAIRALYLLMLVS